MPYAKISELPPQLQSLPAGAKKIFMRAFNSSYSKQGEKSARKIAWAAVKKKYRKGKDGKWKRKVLKSK